MLLCRSSTFLNYSTTCMPSRPLFEVKNTNYHHHPHSFLHPCPERPQRGALHALTDDGIQDITFFSTLLDLVHLASPQHHWTPTRHRGKHHSTGSKRATICVALYGKKKENISRQPMLPPRFLEATFHSLPSRGRDTQNLSRWCSKLELQLP